MDSDQAVGTETSAESAAQVGWRLRVSKFFLPELESRGPVEQAIGTTDVLSSLIYVLFAAIGLVALIQNTDLNIIKNNAVVLIAIGMIGVIAQQLSFSALVSIGDDLPGTFSGSFLSLFNKSALLIFGASAIWLSVLHLIANFAVEYWKQRRKHNRSRLGVWGMTRSRLVGLISATWGGLIALAVYHAAGGQIPISGLSLASLIPALLAIIVAQLIALIAMTPYIGFLVSLPALGLIHSRQRTIGLVIFILGSMGLGLAIDLFAPLLAGLYMQTGAVAAIFLVIGLLLVSWLAHQLSDAIEQSRSRTRELTVLQKLAQAILSAPPDGSQLSKILIGYMPQLFQFSNVAIHLEPDHLLVDYRHPGDPRPPPEKVWSWLRTHPELQSFEGGEIAPWDGKQLENLVLIAPINDIDRENPADRKRQPMGGLYLTQLFFSSEKDLLHLRSAAQVLIDQLETALYGIRSHRTALQLQKVDHELAFGSQIQHSFLPETLPDLPDWAITAVLEPARQTSGDFYDCFPLPDGRWGVLVADVADKGVGAALYMALVRTLIRTYAAAIADPGSMFATVNRRILTDSRADLFVTVFYAVFDPLTGELTYASAGHNPAIWTGPRSGLADSYQVIRTLGKTGIPLGMFEDRTWQDEKIVMEPGDQLAIYTDGLTEAQNIHDDQFGEQRLLEAIQTNAGCTPQELQQILLKQVRAFIGEADQFDDITLVLLARLKPASENRSNGTLIEAELEQVMHQAPDTNYS